MVEPISLDMTKARTMEPLPVDQPYLCAVAKFESGTSASGGRKVHVELRVMKPDVAGIKNRPLFDDINLDNEFTLGRLLNLLKGLGFSEEDIRKPDFTLEPEKMIGLQCTIWVRIRESERFGDRNQIVRIRPAEAYEEAVAPGGEAA